MSAVVRSVGFSASFADLLEWLISNSNSNSMLLPNSETLLF